VKLLGCASTPATVLQPDGRPPGTPDLAPYGVCLFEKV